ncbi:helix-turn-helix domain-containing protein [Lysobacter niastensis]|uniref:Helix-turn-helix domain-containing protein n=1 Tax=Lysobacter niastensis TaxID=380629 RepID=A0ABS0B939_9GAMM|nr:helix-turn-helix domain-containing protein [Lysobacter niastensis]MBF6024207.1 helix-turn-helix domain-containing protein [Lysobacter niastensis]
MEHSQWADRGQLLQLDPPEGTSQAGCVGVSRLGSMQLSGNQFSIWVQLRGGSWVEAKEGRFRLRQGEWIALEKDSKPTVQSDRYGTCIGLTLGPDALKAMARFSEAGLYAGRGRLSRRDARITLRLWREAAARVAPSTHDVTWLRPVLLHLAGIQQDMASRIPRCPGRSRSRKRQVFGRLQRARLYLEGNCDRVVRISELAELTSFSSWYFSKTFHSLYEESPQAASARMRLEHAADLLTSTTMMIGEVAAASGFDNCCSFARAFRARFGLSATRYRSAAMSSRADSAKSLGAGRKAMVRVGT